MISSSSQHQQQQQFASLIGSPLLSTCLEILNSSPQKFMTAQQLAHQAQKKLNKNNANNHKADASTSDTEDEEEISVSPNEVRTSIISNIRHYRNKSPFREFWNRFCSSQFEFETLKNTLISSPFQFMGMSLLTSPVLMWYIPKEAEANFLEIKPSTIPGAGMGLFCRSYEHSVVRTGSSGSNAKASTKLGIYKNNNSSSSSEGSKRVSSLRTTGRRKNSVSFAATENQSLTRRESASTSRTTTPTKSEKTTTTTSSSSSSQLTTTLLSATIVIPEGTIIGEYYGQRCKTAEEFRGNQVDYAVKMNNGEYIVGVDEYGSLLCWCASANDNGMKGRNVALQEFSNPLAVQSGFANRAFFVSTRDIYAGEEIFVTYGADFWGAEKYEDINVIKVSGGGGEASKEKKEDNEEETKKTQKNGSKTSSTSRRPRSSNNNKNNATEKSVPPEMPKPKNSSSSITNAAKLSTSSSSSWSKLSTEFRCRDCKRFIHNHVKTIHTQYHACSGKNPLVIAPDNSLKFINFLYMNEYYPSSSISTNASKPSYSAVLKCLPKNEFTSVVEDGFVSDGIQQVVIPGGVDHKRKSKTGSNKPNSAMNEERKDWCLKRAMSFYGWNRLLTHEVLESSSGSDDDGDDQESDHVNGKNITNEKVPPTKNGRKVVASAATTTATKSSSSPTDDSSSIRRSTTLPLLRQSLSFWGAY